MDRTRNKQFTLRSEHIKLLQHMYVYWDDNAYDGAPAIDIKRPYGNSGGVESDIVEILGLPTVESHGEVTVTDDVREKSLALHKETELALQVLIRCSEIEPGVYEAGAYDSKWVRVGDIPKPPICGPIITEGPNDRPVFVCNLEKGHAPIENGVQGGHDGYWQPVAGGTYYYTSDAAGKRDADG